MYAGMHFREASGWRWMRAKHPSTERRNADPRPGSLSSYQAKA
jgi:hypothetical protein